MKCVFKSILRITTVPYLPVPSDGTKFVDSYTSHYDEISENTNM